ncbi:hypothetical protein [Streptomyces sp. TRM68367]|uniref:hypothetical protein n=1 Tax=Streptomyces sp. TRM68367 TaxID=2758415 RepID=UPI00165A2DEC|nr:hypothetical protein [Streptomyces sp. TRM68367]MBC9729908.1 hypothetical protein [Streptomyces sp. TRM68367]
MNRTVIRDLAAALQALGEHGERLTPTEATPEQLREIGEDMARVRRLFAEADADAPTTRCRRHPHGPVEPGTEGGCLLCRIRPAARHPRPAEAAPLHEVREFIAQHGEAAATRRYGGPATARALNTPARPHRNRGAHTA